ncbi:MAG: phenylalanine--tRNA ligase subunit beta [Bdellovibrionales bacterium]|nr:phenylalanine--tRNA ligase subunit beta [Bdellovibrionales bacterium]
MKISRSWLEDYVRFDGLKGQEFAEVITTRVAEVDAYEVIAAPVDKAVVVELLKVEPHPDKDNLSIVTVSDGKDRFDVVCGAPNVKGAQGRKAAYLAPGGLIYPGGSEKAVEVEIREVSGFQSVGVLASEADLQLSGMHEGVLLLDDSAKAGEPLAKFVGGSDAVIEIDNKSVTHRPDLWCHAGFAREIAAVTGAELIRRVDRWADDSVDGAKLLAELGNGKARTQVKIEPGCGCRRFAALEIDGVSTAESPLWLRRRLYAVGAGVRNILVDLSNYVMHDVGQPNHAYDAEMVKDGLLWARKARSGEAFVGLDEIERTLDAEDIVIADASGPVALGGVIGGMESAVKESTSRLILESANFDPVMVRKTAKRYALRTDASNRFEKSQSAYSVPLALQRYVEILGQVLPSAKPAAQVVDTFVERPASIQVPLNLEFVRERLGADLPDEKISSILTALRFEMQPGASAGEFNVGVPYFRATRDISIAEDLVEEVGRIYGYENIPEQAPLISSTAPIIDPLREFEHALRDRLAANGFYEVSLYSFMGQEAAERLGYSSDNLIQLRNPISSEHDVMRSSLVPGMLGAVERNSRFFDRFGLFEFGRTYESKAAEGYPPVDPAKSPTFERRLLALALACPRDEEAESAMLRPGVSGGAGWYSLRNELRDLLWGTLGVEIEVQAFSSAPKISSAALWQDARGWMHPVRRALVSVGGKNIGVIAEVRSDMLDNVHSRAVVAELDLEQALSVRAKNDEFTPIPKYPDSFFEISVVMPERSSYSKLEKLVRGCVDVSLLRRIELLSLYQGAPLKDNEKSVSIKLFLGAEDRTLSGDELKQIQDGVISSVESSAFALRS